MKGIRFKSALFILPILSLCNVVLGQSIFTNPITGTNPNTANPYITGQTANANITVSGIGRGTGITGTNANDRYNANSWNTGIIDLTAYFEFTLTPNSGFEIDFVSLVYTGQASGTGPTNFAFRSSIDGYTTDIGTPTAGGTTLALSGAAYQNITAPITFRFYGWGASGATGTFSINSFTFNGTVNSACSIPTIQASSYGSSAITSTTGDINWTRGNGNNILVVARAGSAVNQNPANGTSYTANSTFGSGTEIGTGNYVVYDGTGTSVSLAGLTSGITYHFALYEYNTTGTCYLTTSLTGNFTTTVVCSAPTTQALNMTALEGVTNASISWTNGNGTRRVVKINTINSFTTPTDGTDPVANSTYSGSGEQVIYNNIGNNVTVSGLTALTTYFVRVYEYNCTGALTLYNSSTSTNNPISFTTVTIAGTVLNPGDIAIVGYDAQVNGSGNPDLIAFVNMVDLAVGTTFIMTDNGFELSSPSNTRDYSFGNGEGAIAMTWNGPGSLPKGTVTEYRTDVIPSGWSRACISDRDGATVGGCDVFAFNFSAMGDQLFILQGTWNEGTYSCPNVNYTGDDGCANASFSGTYIFGFNGINPGWVPTSQSPIALSGSGNGARLSRLPRELRCFNTEFTSVVTRQQYLDASFDNGTQRQILGTIKGNTDWAAFGVGAFSLGNFTITTGWTAGQWIGDINTNWFDCANWDNLLVPDATTDVELGAFSVDDADIDATAAYSDEFLDIALCRNLDINNQKITLEGSSNDKLEVHGNITINNTSGLDMSDGTNGTLDGQLYLYGNWVNLEDETEFKQGESTVNFVGSGNQTITTDVSDNETFFNVNLNKPSGTLNLVGDDDITIDLLGNMTFTQGIVNTDNIAGSHVIFETSATASSANTNSFVNGPVQKKTNSTTLFAFPIGDVQGVNLFRPVGLVPSTNGATEFEAEYTGVGYGNYAYGDGIDDITEKEWWRVDRNSGTSNSVITLSWGIESDIPTELTNTIGDIKVAYFNGTDWSNQGGSSHLGTTSIGAVSSNEIAGYGAYTLGVDVPLPIQLLYFSASHYGDGGLLKWSTSSEINFNGFEIQKSTNGIDFITIGFIPSNGNTSSYSFITKENEGILYYRLKIIDNDETISYSSIESLSFNNNNSISLYPNPTTSTISLNRNFDSENVAASLVMVNAIGEEVLNSLEKFDKFETLLNSTIPSLSNGFYYIKITLGKEIYSFKLIKY